jgi:hypothetical protein
MGRPAKIARIGRSPYDDDDDGDEDPEADELTSDPATIAAKRDPGYKLEKSRAKAALRLKSTFEDIFDKYGKDFSGVADEVDLRTGKVVVDNGHLQSLKETNFGGPPSSRASSEAGSLAEERILHGGVPVTNRQVLARNPRSHAPIARPISTFQRPSRLSQLLLPPSFGMPDPYMFFRPFSHPKTIFEPAWRIPTFSQSSFDQSYEPRISDYEGTLAPRKPLVRKLLQAARVADLDEDEILLGNSETAWAIPRKSTGATAIRIKRKPLKALGGSIEVTRTPPKQKQGKDPSGKDDGPHAALTSGRSTPVQKRRRPRKRLTEPVENQASGAGSDQEVPKLLAGVETRISRGGQASETTSLEPFSERLGVNSLEDDTFSQVSTAVHWEEKPHNQTLVVAIRAREMPQRRRGGEARRQNGEDNETEYSSSGTTTKHWVQASATVKSSTLRTNALRSGEGSLQEGGKVLRKREGTPSQPRDIVIPDSQNPSPTLTASPVEVSRPIRMTFARNILDPAYNFSDEEDTTIGEDTKQPLAIDQASISLSVPHSPEVVPREPAAKPRKRARPSKHTAKDNEKTEAPPTRSAKPRRRRPSAGSGAITTPAISADQKLPEAVGEEPVPISGQQTPPATPEKEDRVQQPILQTPPSAKHTITSLISDDEEDELSFDIMRATPLQSRTKSKVSTIGKSSPSIPKTVARKKLFSSARRKTATPVVRRLSGVLPKPQSTGKRKVASTAKKHPRVRHSDGGAMVMAGAVSPPESLVRTPGGTMRKCGMDEFRCDRDFCFTCL